jgi:hypothetical protein
MSVRRTMQSLVICSLLACGSDDGPSRSGSDEDGNTGGAKGEDAGADVAASFDLGIPCSDASDSLYGDPGELPAEKGAILRCVDDGTLTKDDVAARLADLKVVTSYEGDAVTNLYDGPAPLAGVHTYRVLYRTERGNGDPGYSVAAMYVPDVDAEERLPLLLLAHGSRGQGPKCAPTVTPEGDGVGTDAPDGRWVHDDLEGMLWPLVSAGFAVAVTDSAGFSNYRAEGNPISGFADVKDMAKSFLDSGHAMRKLLPHGTTDDVLLLGLSGGGHTVLGSLEVANDYEAPGNIIAAAVYSPLWFAQRAWGVTMSPVAVSAGIKLNVSSGVPAAIWYHYTHAEMYDGPGEGRKLFKPEVQDAVDDFVDNVCWSDTYKRLEEATRPEAPASDFFVPELVAAVGNAALNRSCDSSPDKPLCEKWMASYRGDHPVLTGAAAKVPLLLSYGFKDTTIPPERIKCALDKLAESDTTPELCFDPEANHGGIVLRQSKYVNQWLFHKARGTAINETCPSTELPSDVRCDPFLPND